MAWWKNSGAKVPFPRRKHNQLIQEGLYACDEILSVLSLPGNPLEELWGDAMA